MMDGDATSISNASFIASIVSLLSAALSLVFIFLFSFGQNHIAWWNISVILSGVATLLAIFALWRAGRMQSGPLSRVATLCFCVALSVVALHIGLGVWSYVHYMEHEGKTIVHG